MLSQKDTSATATAKLYYDLTRANASNGQTAKLATVPVNVWEHIVGIKYIFSPQSMEGGKIGFLGAP